MAWIRNGASFVDWADLKGPIGGFARDLESEPEQTGIGPVYSPNGQQWYIIVDDAGNVKTTQVT